MNCYIIRIKGDKLSEKMAKKCKKSLPPNLNLIYFDAITPDHVEKYNFNWTFPFHKPLEGPKKFPTQLCKKTNLILKGKPSNNQNRRKACFISHYLLWKK